MSELQKIFDQALQKSKESAITCPNCNSPIRSLDEYCSVCGYNLVATPEEENDVEDRLLEEDFPKQETPIDNSTDDYNKKTSINKMVKVKDSFFDDSVLENLEETVDFVQEEAMIQTKNNEASDKVTETDFMSSTSDDGYFGATSIKDNVINKKKKIRLTMKKK